MRKGLLAALAAAACLAAPSLVAAAPATWNSFGWINIPGVPLTSFDISWIDNDLNTYFLSDRSNSGVDVFGVEANPGVFTIKPTAPHVFAGNVTTCPVSNACNGPNGVLTLTNATTTAKELWVGNGPTMDPACGGTMCSTVYVFNNVPVQKATISTGGTFRADELCTFPVSPTAGNGMATSMVQIANDSDSPPFISWIPVDGAFADTVIQKLLVTDATNGLEQCAYDPRFNVVFYNVPEVNGAGDDTSPGQVRFIFPFQIAKGGPPPTQNLFAQVPLDECAGPQGLAILNSNKIPGNNGILLGCNAPSPAAGQTSPGPFTGLLNSVVLRIGGGSTVLSGQGGSDEVWFDAASTRYFLANGSLLPAQQLGINDAANNVPDVNLFVGFTNGTTRRSHSVAAWSGSPPGLGVAGAFGILPISATGGTPAPGFQSTLCGGMAASGCIAIFGASPIPSN
jgi:hypothetical protein